MGDKPNQLPNKSRRNPYQSLDVEAIQKLLRGDRLASHELLTSGACNTNYRIKTVGGRQYVYRLYARGCPRKDYHAMNRVKDIVPVPRFVEMGDNWVLMDFIDGTPLTPESPALVDVGRCLGLLSSIKFDIMGDLNKDGLIEPLPFGGFLGYFEQELKKSEVTQWLPGDLLEKSRRFLERHADVYNELDQHKAMVHGDFNPGNILINGDKVVGILDWEFAMSGSPRTDTGNILRHLGLEAKGPLEKGMLSSGTHLEEGWEVHSQMADLVSHIDFLSSGHTKEFKQGCVDRITNLVDSFL